MYADFESVLLKQDYNENDTTQKYQKHIPCGSCFYVVSSDDRFYQPPIIHQGRDSAEKFLDDVIATARTLRKFLRYKVPMSLSDEEEQKYKAAATCHICKKAFTNSTEKSEMKVRDHDHLTGMFGHFFLSLPLLLFSQWF